MDDLHRQFKNYNSPDEQSKARREGYRRARAYFDAIPDDADIEHEAQVILERYGNYPRDPFLRTTAKSSRRMKDAFGDGDGWAFRLTANLPQPCAYTLHASHLELPETCSDPANFYCPNNRDLWKGAIRRALKPPLHWKLELGERVHVHIIAGHDAGLLHLPRGGELVKPIYDLEGWLFYIAKPAAQWNAHNLALWMRAKAKRQGNLPQLSGTWRIPNRKRFHREAAY
ncbi:MAG: hypothetical protein M3511_12695 [Deinococcota bacterium]|nr:hypothetical protein [Deinococcota bacterium]